MINTIAIILDQKNMVNLREWIFDGNSKYSVHNRFREEAFSYTSKDKAIAKFESEVKRNKRLSEEVLDFAANSKFE